MRNIKLTIEYDGKDFNGWQKQPDKLNIQGTIEKAIEAVTGEVTELNASGRTDAGVHAKGMVANAHMETKMREDDICDYMNRYLPEDICVQEVRIASDRFHSRYNAQGKTYCYTCYVGDKKPVFNRKYVNIIEGKLDVEAMKKAADILTGEHDYASFCGNPKMKKSTVREIYSIDVSLKGSFLNLTYHGSGFLQYMVRILSGTLLEVGQGKRTPESMYELLEERNRSLAGATAPAKGLCLLKVDYSKEV